VLLIAVIALAVALTFAASGGALARSTFQSSIVSPLKATATLLATPTFTPTDVGDISQTPFALETPPPPIPGAEASPTLPGVSSVTATAPDASNVTPTVSGFLPPPTLVNPNALVPGQLTPLAPENRPLVGPAAPPEPTPTAAPPAAPGAAQLIDDGVMALSYLWLCCGALLLAGVGLAVVWLWRRSKRR
jgi:hypothetical protein